MGQGETPFREQFDAIVRMIDGMKTADPDKWEGVGVVIVIARGDTVDAVANVHQEAMISILSHAIHNEPDAEVDITPRRSDA